MKYYDSCKTLPLRIFFDIIESGNIELLVIDGKVDKAELIEAWEGIINEYADLDDNHTINDVLDKQDQLFTQAALYCEIKGMLIYLIGAHDQEYVDRLNELGYTINVNSQKEKIESIQNNDRRANHISTRMQFIKKSIEKYSEESGKKGSFDEVMASIAMELKLEPSEDITVSRYLAYKKKIHERNTAKRANNGRGNKLA
jgi:hypothetical protein